MKSKTLTVHSTASITTLSVSTIGTVATSITIQLTYLHTGGKAYYTSSTTIGIQMATHAKTVTIQNYSLLWLLCLMV